MNPANYRTYLSLSLLVSLAATVACGAPTVDGSEGEVPPGLESAPTVDGSEGNSPLGLERAPRQAQLQWQDSLPLDVEVSTGTITLVGVSRRSCVNEFGHISCRDSTVTKNLVPVRVKRLADGTVTVSWHPCCAGYPDFTTVAAADGHFTVNTTPQGSSPQPTYRTLIGQVLPDGKLNVTSYELNTRYGRTGSYDRELWTGAVVAVLR